MSTPPATGTDCAWCIDGYTPAGILPILGPVYTPCPHTQPCPACGNQCVFPATFSCLHCLHTHLTAHHANAVICPDCGGITHLITNTDTAGEDI